MLWLELFHQDQISFIYYVSTILGMSPNNLVFSFCDPNMRLSQCSSIKKPILLPLCRYFEVRYRFVGLLKKWGVQLIRYVTDMRNYLACKIMLQILMESICIAKSYWGVNVDSNISSKLNSPCKSISNEVYGIYDNLPNDRYISADSLFLLNLVHDIGGTNIFGSHKFSP